MNTTHDTTDIERKLRAEFAALAISHPTHGWDATEKRLVDAGVFESAAAS